MEVKLQLQGQGQGQVYVLRLGATLRDFSMDEPQKT